jgi:hypothetical protein
MNTESPRRLNEASGLLLAVVIPLSAAGLFAGMYFDKRVGSESVFVGFLKVAAVYLCYMIALLGPISFWLLMSRREQGQRISFLFQIGVLVLSGWLGYESVINAYELLVSKSHSFWDCVEAYGLLYLFFGFMYAIFVCSDMNLFRRAEESKKSG